MICFTPSFAWNPFKALPSLFCPHFTGSRFFYLSSGNIILQTSGMVWVWGEASDFGYSINFGIELVVFWCSCPSWCLFQALESDCAQVLFSMFCVSFSVKHNFLKSNVIFLSLEFYNSQQLHWRFLSYSNSWRLQSTYPQ